MPETCRTCGEIVLTPNAKCLFTEQENDLLLQIQYITGIWLENKFEMPNLICSRCQYDLKEAIIFRERCINTQNYLEKCQLLAVAKTEEDDPLVIAQGLDKIEDRKEFVVEPITQHVASPTASAAAGSSPHSTQNSDDAASLDEMSFTDLEVVIKEENDFLTYNPETSSAETDDIEYNSNANPVADSETRTIRKKRSKKLSKKKRESENNVIKRVQQYSDYLCDQCGIHFRTQNDLNAHMARHEIGLAKPVSDRQTFVKNAEDTQPETTDAELEADIDINDFYAQNSDKNKKRRNIKWKNMTEEEAKALKEKLKKERDYYCTQCGKHFKDPGNYRVHLIRHTGVKKHECKTCNMKFYTASLMRRHERIHITQYECTHCGQKFNHNSSRLRHEKLHTNDRPFKCNYCDKSFPSSSSLKNHELRHIGIRQFYCELCDQGFIRQAYYSAHCRSRTHVQNEQKASVNNSISN